MKAAFFFRRLKSLGESPLPLHHLGSQKVDSLRLPANPTAATESVRLSFEAFFKLLRIVFLVSYPSPLRIQHWRETHILRDVLSIHVLCRLLQNFSAISL